MTSGLPDSARLAWWLSAWLRGVSSPDAVVDVVRGDDAAHHVSGLPATDGLVPLVLALGTVRNFGTTSAGLALPAEGDPVGLGGPPDFNHAALDAGEAVVLDGAGLGLVPARAGRGVVWQCRPALRRQLVDPGEAARGLRAALVRTADALTELDVARWNPDLADEFLNLRRPVTPAAPDGTPPVCVELAGRARQLLDVCDVALAYDGGAVTSVEIAARRAALQPLARAARHALVAACSPEVWPPG